MLKTTTLRLKLRMFQKKRHVATIIPIKIYCIPEKKSSLMGLVPCQCAKQIVLSVLKFLAFAHAHWVLQPWCYWCALAMVWFISSISSSLICYDNGVMFLY